MVEPQKPPWEEMFVKAVIRAREEHGMTQYELAKRVTERGLAFYQVTVQRIEAQERPVRLNEAVVIADVLAMDLGKVLLTRSSEVQAARMARVLIGEIQAAYVESSRSMAFVLGYQVQLERWCAMLGDVEGDQELTDLLREAQTALDLGPSDIAARAQRLHDESDLGKSKAARVDGKH